MSENPAWWSALADSQQSSGSWLHQKSPYLSCRLFLLSLGLITGFAYSIDSMIGLTNCVITFPAIKLFSYSPVINSFWTYFTCIHFIPIFEYILVSTINTRCMGHGDQILSTASNPPSINLDKLSLLEHL